MRFAWKILIGGLFALMLLGTLCACIREETPPELIRTRKLTFGVGGPLPQASDFVENLPEGYTVRYAEQYDFNRLGDYQLKIAIADLRGRESIYDVAFTLMMDHVPPTIHGVRDISAYIGEGIAYRNGVTVSDNCDGAVKLEVDSSAVNMQEAGAYEVRYTATDAAGNQSTATARVYLYREEITEDMLYVLLDPIISERIPSAFSTEQKVREVYEYVYYSISYDAYSDKSDWVRAAYEGLKSGRGDCFTYFAISKAFFKRLGIESMDIQRTEGLVDERHYWNYVNLGSAQAPRWYHFDATRLSGVQHNGCLLTDQQLAAYTRQRDEMMGRRSHFYTYDATKYPVGDPTVITSTPTLEPYY